LPPLPPPGMMQSKVEVGVGEAEREKGLLESVEGDGG